MTIAVKFGRKVTPCTNRIEWLNENEKDKEYRGFIIEKLHDPKFKMAPVLILHDNSKHRISNDSIYDLIDTGDYLRKDPGSFKYTLYHVKTRDSIYYYPRCEGEDIK